MQANVAPEWKRQVGAVGRVVELVDDQLDLCRERHALTEVLQVADRRVESRGPEALAVEAVAGDDLPQ
ncbi:MAG: hypothetical protein ACE5FP_10010 [Gemmatimonadota bacterium]